MGDRASDNKKTGKFFCARQWASLRSSCSPKHDIAPIQEDNRARFYEDYRKVAEEYDKEFLKKHDEDLNTTLIFVSSTWVSIVYCSLGSKAGLFSAVTSAFIIQVDPQLQPDPNDQTAALLRVLIYKIDNTTFGNNVPALPQWTGPPSAIVQVQAILFASLGISIFSAFLAMLGKQWLNRYDSTDVRGSAIERSHNRQQKLGGIVGWYFDYVMESLPLMLQAALLLLGCALSRYLWEINTAIASVVLGVTSFGVFFYLFIMVAGSISEGCPYQTPGARILRHILHHHFPILRSAPSVILVALSHFRSRFIRDSRCYFLFINWWSLMNRPWYSLSNIAYTLNYCLFPPPVTLVMDGLYFGRVILVAFSGILYRFFVTALSPRPSHSPEQLAILSDLRCISWILQTSLDKTVHLSAFERLVSIPELGHLDPTLVVDCFRVFLSCINITNGKAVILQGLDQLAAASIGGFSRTLHHLVVMDPTSSILADLHRRYNKVFPVEVDFTGLPFRSTMAMVHTLVNRFGNPRYVWWDKRILSGQEFIPFSRRMVEAALVNYRQTQSRKVPRWMLRSALHFLSLGSSSPESVIADYLTIIAIDLGCDFPDTTSLEERCVCI